MIIYPAIDLIEGKCVRLYQGKFESKTEYAISPFEQAQLFAQAGAKWMHLVDLSGAKQPEKNQLPFISELIKSSALLIQVGGGIRTAEQINALLAEGAARVVIGSLAVISPKAVCTWLQLFGPEKFVLPLT